jgi:hypothetical protein
MILRGSLALNVTSNSWARKRALTSFFRKSPMNPKRISLYTFSRRLAYVFGVSLPIIQTIRRWSQLGDPRIWPVWLDDFLLAALLLLGARLTSAARYQNARYLAAAWGVACGMAYGGFFNHAMHLDVSDPSGIPTIWVVVLKGIGFALAIAALIGALQPQSPAPPEGLLQHPERLEQMLDASDDA